MSMNVTSWTPSLWESNEEEFKQQLQVEVNWNQIPIFNSKLASHFSNGQLVRFCGMIQDMQNPEFYIYEYEVKNTTTGIRYKRSAKYRDMFECGSDEEILDGSPNLNAERQSLYCITIPGLNKWVTDSESRNVPSTSTESRGQKRGVDEMMDVESAGGDHLSGNKHLQNRKDECDLNFPLPGTRGQACILKIYDTKETLLLNEMVEVAGFLYLDPHLLIDEFAEDQSTHGHPPSVVPHLHVIAFHRLAHCVPSLLPKIHYKPVAEQILNTAGDSVLNDLRRLLKPLVLDDELATEYLICHLISHVFTRNETTALGKFSMNMYNVPLDIDFASNFNNIIQLLLPKSWYLPMTLENLNQFSLVPKKDHQLDQLKSGLLQLSNGTHLILDETKLSTGQLGDQGTRNMLALFSLINHQKLDYDFQFCSIEFKTDIPVLIFSEKKSILPVSIFVLMPVVHIICCSNLQCDVLVPIVSHENNKEVILQSFVGAQLFLRNPKLIGQIRAFLSAAKLVEYTIPDFMQEIIQNDFVELRQHNQTFKGEDLHFLLVLARYVTIIRGKKNLDQELWNVACKMEKMRKERFNP